jgi:transcriptional regulator with XRE-family HTH domain
MQRFGEKLRALRKQHGMTLEELALALGLTTHSHLSNIESGRKKPSLELAIKIADFFKVTVDQLVRDNLDLD